MTKSEVVRKVSCAIGVGDWCKHYMICPYRSSRRHSHFVAALISVDVTVQDDIHPILVQQRLQDITEALYLLERAGVG